VDGDFQQQYQDAERAYSEGDYTEAQRLASDLLEQLVDQPQDPDAQAAVLGWRAFVALLLGHIELYGHDNPSQAAGYYEQVLASQPQDTLAELAQQGLERSRQSNTAPSQRKTAHQPLPEMLRDPFLTDQPTGSKATAIPWLESSTPEPTPPPEPSPQPTPVPSPEPTPEASPEPSPEPTPTEIPILEAELLPESNPEPTVELENDETEPDNIEEDPREVLAGSLLRVKIISTRSKRGRSTATLPVPHGFNSCWP
jgi:outer membrane biosynthesis protein TonB